ncbi:MAG: DUF1207 domain-containing protein [Rhodospirillales bacterium]|nr:DUF1207 domain-containing protein [Rhodospirillales bacterium]
MRRTRLLAAFAVVLLFLPRTAAAATPPSDAYLTGYVSAIVEREFRLKEPRIAVDHGAVTVFAEGLSAVERSKLGGVLAEVDGVVEVRIFEPDATGDEVLAPAAPAPESLAEGEAAEQEAQEEKDTQGLIVLPRGRLFDPLIADPRWPHFSASYQRYLNDDEVRNAGAVSFGETFGLLRGEGPGKGNWQFNFQAAVFGLFDLDAESNDLINADYWVGLPVSYRDGDFSALARVFHQSSHLGDEFILRSRTDRVNLSYEGVDLRLSQNLGAGFRIYGGGGYLIHREPSDLKPWSTQAGAQYISPYTLIGGLIRPIAGADFQNRQESGWRTDVSLKAGVQFESPEEVSQTVQLMFEYFNGRNPNGQFYERTLEYLGVGAHVYF